MGTVYRAPGDYPSGKQGDVLSVEFTVIGIPCLGLISPRLAVRLLAPPLLFGAFSVLYWRATDSGDGGDLRLYVLVQYLPMLLIPAIVLSYRSALAPTSFVWALLGSYGVAKVLELLDGPVLRITGVVSGHTLKHLIAALGVYFLLLGCLRRTPVPGGPASPVPAAVP